MKVIVETCGWSLALRRHKTLENEPYVTELGELIGEVRVQLFAPIRQEILSGVADRKLFEKLKNDLSAFPDLNLGTEVYEEAANYYNLNRSQGVQVSNTDFLICAASRLYGMPVLTFDRDFQLFQKHIPAKIGQ